MLRTAVALMLVAAAFTLTAMALAQEPPPDAPQGVRLRIRDGGPLISWLPVTGAKTYEIREAFCETGSQNKCAIARVTETSWKDPTTRMPEGGYLIAACDDDSGCGEAVQPELMDDRPEAPEWIKVEETPDGILISWPPVEGASEYQVLYHGSRSRLCRLEWPEQELLQCHEAGRTADTRFLHREAGELGAKYYWVAACNEAGCRKGKGKGAELGDFPDEPQQEQEPTASLETVEVKANLTISRPSVREGENFTATLDAQAQSGEPGTLNLRLSADGPLHVTAVAGQESCGPGCVSLTHKINGNWQGSLSAGFTAGQRGSAKVLWSVKWEPDGRGQIQEENGERTITILANRDSPDPVIQSIRPTPAPTVPPPTLAVPNAGTSSSGCNAGPAAGLLLGLVFIPGAMRRTRR